LLFVCLVAFRANAAPYDCDKHATAPDRELEARALFDEALRLERSDPERAIEILSCARRFADKPSISLRIGTIAERLGKLELAIEGFERYLQLAGDLAPDRAPMQKRIESLREKLEESQDVTAGITPVTPKRDEPRKSPLPGYILAGAGGVLMVLGGVLLYSAKSQSDDVHEIEPGTVRWNSDDAKGKIESAKRTQTIGIITLAAGAVASGLGVYLVLDARQSKRSAQGGIRFAF
jgi:hypothetical protein